MKIILEHDEFLSLQMVCRNPGHYAMGQTLEQQKENKFYHTQETLRNAGLVKTNLDSSLFWDRLYPTKLGQEILKQHSPWIEPGLHFWRNNSKPYSQKIEIRPLRNLKR